MLDECDIIKHKLGLVFKGYIPATKAWCRQYGLLATNYTCPPFQSNCNQQNSRDKIDEIGCSFRNAHHDFNIYTIYPVFEINNASKF